MRFIIAALVVSFAATGARGLDIDSTADAVIVATVVQPNTAEVMSEPVLELPCFIMVDVIEVHPTGGATPAIGSSIMVRVRNCSLEGGFFNIEAEKPQWFIQGERVALVLCQYLDHWTCLDHYTVHPGGSDYYLEGGLYDVPMPRELIESPSPTPENDFWRRIEFLPLYQLDRAEEFPETVEWHHVLFDRYRRYYNEDYKNSQGISKADAFCPKLCYTSVDELVEAVEVSNSGLCP